MAADFDGDGRIDLFVANDTTANYLCTATRAGSGFWKRARRPAWRPVVAAATRRAWAWPAPISTATACSTLPSPTSTPNPLRFIKTSGSGLFTDRTAAAGLTAATRFVLGFGLIALDANNDGHPDLAQANGHVADFRPAVPYAMPAQLLLNDGKGRFTDVSERAGSPWKQPPPARGLAAGDLDNDGRIDLVMVAENAPLALLRNQTVSSNHFLTFDARGNATPTATPSVRGGRDGRRPNSDRRTCPAEAATSRRAITAFTSAWVQPRSSTVEVTWPSGRRETAQWNRCRQGLSPTRGRPGRPSASCLRQSGKSPVTALLVVSQDRDVKIGISGYQAGRVVSVEGSGAVGLTY